MLALRVGGHKDLRRCYNMMEIDFDSEELFSRLTIHKALLRGEAELLIFFDEESKLELGYALVLTKNVYGYVLLKYFGIYPWYRNHGMGIEAMRLMNRRYAETSGILAEITEFEDPEENHVRKLLKYFSRFGYEPVNIDHSIAGVKANVMVKPMKSRAAIDRAAKRILADFYGRV